MNPPMYREYREVKEFQLVDETIQSVVGAACSFESDRATVIEVGQETEADEAEDPASLPGTDAEDSVFEQAMLHVLRNGLVGDCKMDEETEQSWVEFLKDVKTFMGEGIAIQRNTYLRECA
ncbi:hypothetical protein COOONC_18888 [Cooperia oncophora]